MNKPLPNQAGRSDADAILSSSFFIFFQNNVGIVVSVQTRGHFSILFSLFVINSTYIGQKITEQDKIMVIVPWYTLSTG